MEVGVIGVEIRQLASAETLYGYFPQPASYLRLVNSRLWALGPRQVQNLGRYTRYQLKLANQTP